MPNKILNKVPKFHSKMSFFQKLWTKMW